MNNNHDLGKSDMEIAAADLAADIVRYGHKSRVAKLTAIYFIEGPLHSIARNLALPGDFWRWRAR